MSFHLAGRQSHGEHNQLESAPPSASPPKVVGAIFYKRWISGGPRSFRNGPRPTSLVSGSRPPTSPASPERAGPNKFGFGRALICVSCLVRVFFSRTSESTARGRRGRPGLMIRGRSSPVRLTPDSDLGLGSSLGPVTVTVPRTAALARRRARRTRTRDRPGPGHRGAPGAPRRRP